MYVYAYEYVYPICECKHIVYTVGIQCICHAYSVIYIYTSKVYSQYTLATYR